MLRIFAHVMPRRDLDLLTLIFYSISGVMRLNSSPYKIRVKSNNPRLSYRRFSTYSRANLGGGSQLTELSQGCMSRTSANLARTQDDHRSIVLLFQNLNVLLYFQMRATQS